MPNKPVAIITGGTRGIGKGIATKLAAEGWDLVLNHVSPPSEAVAQTVQGLEKLGCKLIPVQADISTATGRSSLVEATQAMFGRCDLLVNNAGIAPKIRSDLLETTEESYAHVMDINLKGPFFLTQLVAKWMIEQTEKLGRKCRIINIGSISAFTSSPARSEYCLSKAGLGMMTALFADRLAEYNIGVYELRPGIIETDMTSVVKEKYDKLISEGLTPIRRWGKPEDIANGVFAIASGLLDFATGEVINLDGGFHLKRL